MNASDCQIGRFQHTVLTTDWPHEQIRLIVPSRQTAGSSPTTSLQRLGDARRHLDPTGSNPPVHDHRFPERGLARPRSDQLRLQVNPIPPLLKPQLTCFES